MKYHQLILEDISRNQFPTEINENIFPLFVIFNELYEQGYIEAINESGFGGYSYFEPKITHLGERYLAGLRESNDSPPNKSGTGISSDCQHIDGNSVKLSMNIYQLTECVARISDKKAKSNLRALLNNEVVASLIGPGVAALLTSIE